MGMKGYKGFAPGLICNGKQYAENTVFEEEKAEICECGMHFCENPLDVLEHYPPVNEKGVLNEFAEVEALDECLTNDDKKFCAKKLKVGAKIGLDGLIKAFIDFTFSKIDFKDAPATNTGNQSAATNTGYRSAATNTGYQSAATNTGYWSAATNTGNQSAATNTGYWSAATNTGDRSAATNTGDWSAATNTGYWSAASVEGKESFAIATGYEGKAKGALGCYIAVAEWEIKNNERKLLDFKTHVVDGEEIKADTFYMLKDGKFVEAEE